MFPIVAETGNGFETDTIDKLLVKLTLPPIGKKLYPNATILPEVPTSVK